jgi:hypothetical protein
MAYSTGKPRLLETPAVEVASEVLLQELAAFAGLTAVLLVFGKALVFP